MTAQYFTLRNDYRIPVTRRSSDAVWPLRCADGRTWADKKDERK